MKYYELTYLITPDLSEKDLEELLNKIPNIITGFSGIVEKIQKSEKIKLGYPINKKNGAFLASLDFSLNQEKIKELEEKIKSEKAILKYLIINKKRGGFSAKKERRKPVEKNKEEKVEIEKINETIDEILK